MDDGRQGPAPREWDATSYHRVSRPHDAWGAAVVDRLGLRGDETVLDLGCGTGKVTALLLERLPEGHVVGIDGSAQMIEQVRERLPERTTFVRSDLLELSVDGPADAAVSSATFHWIADHDRLFARVRAALRPGARFVAQCGGRGNIAGVVAAAGPVCASEPFAPYLDGWEGPWNFAGPEETAQRLEHAGFAVEDCWLEPSPQQPEPLREFLATVTLGSHLDRLPADLRERFVDAVVAGLPDPPVLDYVRLNLVATAA